MEAINNVFVAENDFKEQASHHQPDRSGDSLQSESSQVCHVDTQAIDESKAPKLPQIFAALPAVLGSFIFGTYLGWCSPVQPQVKNVVLDTRPDKEINIWHLAVQEDQMSWICSLFNIGAMVGCISGGVLMDKFGRKMVLALVFSLYISGWLFISLAVVPFMFHIGRIIGGVGAGICCVVSPTYIGETSTVSMRGFLGLCFSGMIAAGILTSSLLGFLDWRWMSAICCALPLIVLVGIAFIPDSPYFLIKRGRHQEAVTALLWLRGNDYNFVKAELSLIESLVLVEDATINRSQYRFSDLFHPAVYKPLLIGVSLMVLQQVSGINAAIFNSVEIFQLSGSSIDSLVSAIILNAVLLAGAVLSSFLIERLGRRILYLISSVLTSISVFALGGYFYVVENDRETAQRLGWIPVPLLIFYIAVLGIGVGPLPWLVSAEVMPTRFKGPGSSIVASSNWIASFIVTKAFINMQRSLTNAGTFWLFGGLTSLGILFGLFFLPETKGKTHQEIQDLFNKDSNKQPE